MAELYVDIMGHDINNLNQTALSKQEFLLAQGGLTGEQRNSIDHTIKAILGSAAIINNVRHVQSIAEGRMRPEPQDIDGMISECIKEAPRPADKKIDIHYIPQKGLRVMGIPLLKEAFCNIINNAIKYSGKEAIIDIDVSEASASGIKYFYIAISDNGPGIPDNIKPKLFKRLQRGTTAASGTGLGLYITKMVIEQAGGSVRVEDRVPGDPSKGSRFIITLPALNGGDGSVSPG